MKERNQSGFAHLVVVTVILAFAVVGLLGFVFWQNFMYPKTKAEKTGANSVVAKPVEKGVTYKTVSFDSSKTIAASYRVPNAWAVEKTSKPATSDFGGMETIRITSPDGNVFINTSATNATGIGGTCLPEDAGNFYMFTSSEIKNFAIKVDLVESAIRKDGVYTFTSEVSQPYGHSDTAMIGRSLCESMFAGMIPYKAPTGLDGYFQAEIHVDSLTTYYSPSHLPGPKALNSMSPINAALESEDYKTARAILLSLSS